MSQSNSSNSIFLFYNKFINKAYECNMFNLNNENLFIQFKSKLLND